MELPQDNYMLLSLVNMKLRDGYASLEDFCADYGVSTEDICARMRGIGYVYDPSVNAFK